MNSDLTPELSEITESFGEYLRRHREASGKTLDDVSRTTRISKRYLEAFETNTLNHFPEEAFARGFVRNYAVDVGIDPDECLRRFDQLIRSNIPTQIRDMKKPGRQNFLLGEEKDGSPRRLIMIAGGGALLILIAVSLLFVKKPVRDPAAARESATQVEAPAMVTPEVSSDAAMTAPLPPSTLLIEATGRTSLAIRLDDSATQEIIIEAGQSKTFEVRRQIEIQNFNRNMLKLQYNGKSIDLPRDHSTLKLFNRNLFSE